MEKKAYYSSPIGWLQIAERDGKITKLHRVKESMHSEEAEVFDILFQELDEYFEGKRKEFSVPLDMEIGTEFQRKVWKALMEIPYGETRSYGEVAAAIGKEKACRAVGMANNKNPISILIPCHRVIGANGELVGYGGGLDMKTYLLDLEK